MEKCNICGNELDIEAIIYKTEAEMLYGITKEHNVCSKCVYEKMSVYGDGDDVCMSGADDIRIDKRTAYFCFGM